MTTPRIAAAYIRVSTDEQADQSPESQLIEIRKYADRNSMILPQEYVFVDEGISGKRTENRPAFLRMIGTAKETPAPFDTILLWKFSRFARNQEESIVYKALLRKQCGVDVVSVSEPLPGGMFSSLIERIIEWFDEFYSIRLSQEVKRTMTVKAGRGEFQSSPSFGYRARIVPGEKTVLEPIPEEAALVREIFDRFNSGEGCYPIARWLNSQGVTTHRGNQFENRTVEYILRNPVYIGKLRWTPSGRMRRNFQNEDTIIADGAHEPIVTLEAWEAAQKRLDKLKVMWGYKARPSHELKDWLGGVVRCSECGTTLIFAKPHYFKCNNYARGKCRSSQHVHVDLLHDAVIRQLKTDMDSSLPITFTVERKTRENGESDRLSIRLADLRRRKDRLVEAYLSEAMDLDTYQKMNRQLSAEIEEAEKRLGDLRASDTAASSDDAKAAINAAIKTIEAPDASIEAKNEAIRSITEKIVFSKDKGTLDIVYRIFI